jgi:hypothetical protein
VYSQQDAAAKQPKEWSHWHQQVVTALFSEDVRMEVDDIGRLIVLDGSPATCPFDHDGDGFHETIVIAAHDAATIIGGNPDSLYKLIRGNLHEWGLLPSDAAEGYAAHSKSIPPEVSGRPGGLVAERLEIVDHSSNEVAVVATEGGVVQPDEVADPNSGLARGIYDVAGRKEDRPSPAQGVAVLVGHALHDLKSRPRYLNISDTKLNQLNVGVVGDLGTGKTQLIKSLIYQVAGSARRNRGVKPRFLIFDYKKDYRSPEFVEATGAKVVLPKDLPINLFDVAGAPEGTTPWMDRYKFFADVMTKIFPGIGAVQHNLLKQAVKESYKQAEAMGRQPTIYQVHANYRTATNNKVDGLFSVLDDIVDMQIFSDDPKGASAFDKFFDGVVVVALDALGQDDRTKNMLVAMMLNMFYEQMLRVPKRPYEGANPQLRVVDSFLLVDEADNIMRYEFDVLRKILLQGREFGVGVILASQYLKHFKAGATDYREPLLTWLIHKVPNVSPAELSALGMTNDLVDLAESVKGLANHCCLYKTHDAGGILIRGTPFYELLKGAQGSSA